MYAVEAHEDVRRFRKAEEASSILVYGSMLLMRVGTRAVLVKRNKSVRI